ncbi:MAG: hypothetical protein ACK41V_23640, partial [Acidovorax sp.]
MAGPKSGPPDSAASAAAASAAAAPAAAAPTRRSGRHRGVASQQADSALPRGLRQGVQHALPQLEAQRLCVCSQRDKAQQLVAAPQRHGRHVLRVRLREA